MNSKGHFVLTSILALVHLGTSTTILYKDLCQEEGEKGAGSEERIREHTDT